MPPSSHNSFGPTRQRGVVTILTASLLMLLLLVMVLALDTGRLYLEKRKLQNIADMAVLSTVAREPQTCTLKTDKDEEVEVEDAAKDAAEDAAEENGFLNNGDWSLDVSCEDQRVKVTATHNVPKSIVLGGIFNDDPLPLTATATAQRNEPIAAFTVSSRLLSLNNDKLVGRLLTNVGLNPEELEILSSEGLLNTSITPSGLLSNLGIDVSIDNLGLLTPQSLTYVSGLSVNEIIDASLELVGNDTTRLELKALSNHIASSSLDSIDLLGSNGLIRLTSGSREQTRAALGTEINLGELLSLAVITGTGEKSLEIPALELLGVNISAGITSPPALAIGPATAIDADGKITYPTQAHTGQLRLSLNFDTKKIPVVKTLLGLLNTRIYLPLTIDVASANATLTNINCEAGPPTADIDVSSSLLEVCLGDMPETGDPLWLGSQSCSAIATRTNTDLIRLLKLTLLGPSKLVLGAPNANNHTLSSMAVSEERSYVPPNALSLGATVVNLIAGVFNEYTTNSNDNNLAERIADDYLKASSDNKSSFLGVPYELYSPKKATALILNGGTDINGEELPPLANDDWYVSNYKANDAGNFFSLAFNDMSNNGSFLGLGAIPITTNNYSSCGGLIGDLAGGLLGDSLGAASAYNKCVKNNLSLLLQRKPGGLDLEKPEENANTGTSTICEGFICNLLRRPLDNVSNLLTDLISESLGLELGRADIRVESISCGVPTLVE